MKDEGGHVFPFPPRGIEKIEDTGHGLKVILKAASDGITLRDWFAGQALQGALSGLLPGMTLLNIDSKTMAGFAYDMADAMIAERNKGE